MTTVPRPEQGAATPRLTEEEAAALLGDDIRYWMGNPFLDVDARVEKVLWWLAQVRGAGREKEATLLARFPATPEPEATEAKSWYGAAGGVSFDTTPTPARDEALRDRVARAIGEVLHADTCDGNPGHAEWDDCATTGPCAEEAARMAPALADALLGVLADNRAEAWDEGAQAATDWIKSGAWLATMPENPYREEATDG